MSNDNAIGWRDAANTQDFLLKVNTNDQLEYDGNVLTSLALGNAHEVLTVNAGGTATEYDLIDDDNIVSGAGIDASKIADGSVSDAEFQFIGTLTSDIQTQHNEVLHAESTGLLSGGAITVNGGDAAKFDIAAGIIQVVDAFTDAVNATETHVSFGPFTAQTVTALATDAQTEILINAAGAIVQQTTSPTDAQLRSEISLGSLVHASGVAIDAIIDTPLCVTVQPGNSITGLSLTLGILNKSGNVFSDSGADLKMDKSVGDIWGAGINLKVDPENPDLKTLAALTEAAWFYTWRDGSGGWEVSVGDTDIVPGSYDDNSGGASVPGGTVSTNNWSIQRIFMSTSNQVLVYYGQNTYSSLAGAQAVAQSENVVNNPGFIGAFQRGWLIVRGGGSALNAVGDAQFLNAGILGNTTGGGGSTSTTTLQEAYENGSEPEIILNATRGTLNIEDASSPLGTALFAISDFGGSNDYFSVSATAVTIATLTADRALQTGTGGVLESSATTKAELAFVNGVTSAIQTQLDALQTDVITTRGDIVKGSSGAAAERLALGNAKEVLSVTADGLDVEWALGGSGGVGKNYILNPDATVNATSDVTNTDTTGAWTVAQTTTAAELPEETKGTAFKISGSGLTVNDTVEWAIPATFIDDADAGPSTLEFKVKDISGTIAGEYKFQLWSVTDSTYIGESLTVVSDGTYTFGAQLIAGDDYQLHLIALVTSPTNIGISGVKLSPTALLKSAVVSSWTVSDAALTNVSATAKSIAQRQVGENIELRFNYSGTLSVSGNVTVALPTGLTLDTTFVSDVTVFDGNAHAFETGVAHNTGTMVFKDSVIKVVENNSNQWNATTPFTWDTTDLISIFVSVPVAEFANAGVVVPVSDLTKRTKTVQIELAGGTWSATAAKGFAFSDSTGDWWLTFSVRGTTSAPQTDRSFTVTGVAFPAYDQVVNLATDDDGTSTLEALAEASGNTLHLKTDTASQIWAISGTIRLASQPTDAFVDDDASFSSFTASLENATSVAAHFEDEAAADETAQQLIPQYQKQTLALDGAFSAVNAVIVRIGDVVTLTFDSAATVSSASSGSSTAAMAADFRPSDNVRTVIGHDGTSAVTLIINSDGTIDFESYDDTGLISVANLGGFIPTMSYVIT